jgi:hypothetical protein
VSNPLKKMGVLVGSTGSRQENTQVYSLLRLYTDTEPAMAAFHAYWVDFQNWARENGLRAQWLKEHDGVGINGWARLTVTPLPGAPR